MFSGVSLGEGTGATMSDDEDDLHMDFSLDQSASDSHDLMGFGPLLPTETERSLMERVRQELKIELKQVMTIYIYIYIYININITPTMNVVIPCRVLNQELKM